MAGETRVGWEAPPAFSEQVFVATGGAAGGRQHRGRCAVVGQPVQGGFTRGAAFCRAMGRACSSAT